MKNITPLFLYRVIPLLFVGMLFACSHDEGIEASEMTYEKMSVSISLSGQNSSITRTSGEDADDEDGEFGNLAENYINIEDLYILTFSIPEGESNITDNSKLLEILWAPADQTYNKSSVITSNGEDVYLKTFLATDKEIPEYGRDFCVVVLANLDNFPHLESKITLDSGEEEVISAFTPKIGDTFGSLRRAAKYSYKDAQNENEWNWLPDNQDHKGIPLFGVKKVNLSGYNKKYHNESNPFLLSSNGNSTVWLLRSFAKVSIELADELKSLTVNGEKVNISIESANVTSYGNAFEVIPQLSRMKGFSSTGGTGQIIAGPDYSVVNSFNPELTSRPLAFNLNSQKDLGILYLTESRITASETAAQSNPLISVTINRDGTPQEYKFALKEYATPNSNAAWWNYVLRNHTYRFKITVDYRIVSVDPTPWGDVFNNEFTFGQQTTPTNP